MKQSNVEKLMRFVVEHRDSISQILKFLNEQDKAKSIEGNVANSDKQDPGYSVDQTEDQKKVEGGTDVADADSADEDANNVMKEGEEEKAGTESTSDGNDYPADGLGGGVEDPSLTPGAQPRKSSYDCSSKEDLDESEQKEEEVTEENKEEEKIEEDGGTASAPAPGGASVGAPAPQGSANTGIARAKSRLGEKPKKRYDESVSNEEREVLEMIEGWKNRDGYRIIGL